MSQGRTLAQAMRYRLASSSPSITCSSVSSGLNSGWSMSWARASQEVSASIASLLLLGGGAHGGGRRTAVVTELLALIARLPRLVALGEPLDHFHVILFSYSLVL